MNIEIYRDADYREILQLQRRRFAMMIDRRRSGMPVEEEWLMAVEHRPVYTLGRHGQTANLLRPDFLKSRNIELVEIERGGDITFHGPGQVVVYPLIDLAKRGLGVKAYVNLLEEAVICTVGEWGVEATRLPDAPGVWIETPAAGSAQFTPSGMGVRKICALGIKCSRFISMHGLALNVTTDMRYFSAINPCGFTDRGATNLLLEAERASFPTAPTWERVAPRLLHHLSALLEGEGAGGGKSPS